MCVCVCVCVCVCLRARARLCVCVRATVCFVAESVIQFSYYFIEYSIHNPLNDPDPVPRLQGSHGGQPETEMPYLDMFVSDEV